MSEQNVGAKHSRFSPLAFKLLLSALAFGALLCFVITYMGYRQFSNVFTTQYNRMTTQFAYISASYITGDQISRYNESRMVDEDYSVISEKLMEITNVADLESISVTVPDTIKYETQTYIFHTVNARYADRVQRFSIGSPEYIAEKSRESIINMKRVMLLGRLYTEYEFGEHDGQATGTVTTVVPLRDKYNSIVAMLSVTKSIDEMLIVQSLYLKRISLVALAVSVLFILLYGLSLWRMIIRPVLIIKNEMSFFALNNKLSGLLSKIKKRDEIGSLAHAFEDMSEKINRYITELTTVTAEKERINTELNVATKIQAEMLPIIFPPFPDRTEFDIYASMTPAKEVGGDFYDFFMVDERHIAVVAADVSGKGVPAALFMVIGKTLIKDHTQPGAGPAEIFMKVNNLLCEANGEELFITAFLGILDLVTGELKCVSAGHEPPYIYHDGKWTEHKIKKAFVLAGMEDMKYSTVTLQLEPGDKLFQYTDGVTEATDAHEQLYGDARLDAALNRIGNIPAKELCSSVKADIDAFVGEAPQFDDITMLCLEYKARMQA